MIKYLQFNRFDEYGEHITPVKNISRLEKTASPRGYSSKILNFVESIEKNPSFYYVVMDAVGSFEYWGRNSNADIFPESGLSHLSLPSDAGTPNDFGYKTFEYYAKFYKHHVNKDPKRSFGEVLFSYWNPIKHRVELVVGIDRFKSKSTITKLENGEDVAVSMGCKVQYDICSICGKKITKRSDDCKHLKFHLKSVVDEALARQWSRELGKTILAGAVVGMINEKPRFFDISEVNVGADGVAHILGKVASSGVVIRSTDLAEAVGVTDDDIDKVASVIKASAINKRVEPSTSSADGIMYSAKKLKAVRGVLEEEAARQIDSEPDIPSSLLDLMVTSCGLDRTIGTIDNLGIAIRPKELQRMVLVSDGRADLADKLERRGIFFNNINIGDINPVFPHDAFDYAIDSMLSKITLLRSSVPTTMTPKRRGMAKSMAKSAAAKTEYDEVDQSLIATSMPYLASAAAIYLGLSDQAQRRAMKDLVARSAKSPTLKTLAGGAILYNLVAKPSSVPDEFLIPASEFENVLAKTNFSGHTKSASGNMSTNPKVKGGLKGAGVAGLVAFPLAHFISQYNRSHIINTGKPAGVIAHSIDPIKTPLAASALAGGLGYIGKGLRNLR